MTVPRCSHLSLFPHREWTGPADLQAKHPNQAAIANESRNPHPEIDDLAFRKLAAQFIEQGCVRAVVITRENFRVMNSGFFARTE